MSSVALSAQRSQAEVLIRAARAIIDPDVDQIIIDYLHLALSELVWRDRATVVIGEREVHMIVTEAIDAPGATDQRAIKSSLPADKIEAGAAIKDSPLSPRTINVLLSCGFRHFGELLKWDRDVLRDEVLRCPNAKKRTWLEIQEAVERI